MKKNKTTCIKLLYALLALIVSPIFMIMVPFVLPYATYKDLLTEEECKEEFYCLDAKNTKREAIKVKYDRKHQKIELSEIQKSQIIELFKQLFNDNEEEELNIGVHLTRVELENK